MSASAVSDMSLLICALTCPPPSLQTQALTQEIYEHVCRDRPDMTEQEMQLAAEHEARLAAVRIDKERKCVHLCFCEGPNTLAVAGLGVWLIAQLVFCACLGACWHIRVHLGPCQCACMGACQRVCVCVRLLVGICVPKHLPVCVCRVSCWHMRT